MSPAAKAWAVLWAGVIAYDVLCPPNETLSEGCDRALAGRWRIATEVALAATYLHLANRIPQPDRFDPFRLAITPLRRWRQCTN